MKNLILFLFLTFTFSAFGQRSVNKYYHKFKNETDARSVAVPGILFKIGSHYAKKNLEDDDQVGQMSADLMKKVKNMKVLFVEDYSPLEGDAVRAFTDGAKKDGFEDLFMFKTAGTDIHFLMRDKGDIIQNLVILVSSEEEGLVLMNMKAKLSKSEIKELIDTAMRQAKDDDGYYEDTPPAEEKKAEEKKAVSKEPRA